MNMSELLDKKDIPEVPGIYCFENTSTGKKYIGSSNNLRSRYTQHISKLSENLHTNRMLQEAYDTSLLKYYVIESFPEGIDVDALFMVEQKWIDYYNSTDPRFGYNKVNSYKGNFSRNVINSIGKNKPKRSFWAVVAAILEEVLKRNRKLKWIYTIWKICRRL